MALVALAVVVFATTNLDDLIVLLALFSDPTQRARDVVAGQFLGMATLTFVAIGAALAATSVSSSYVGLLGFLPLLIGLSRLVFRRDGELDHLGPKSGSAENVFVAAAVTVANGGDNIAVYVPLLAAKTWAEIALIAVVFSILTAVWCAVARLVVAQPRIAVSMKRLEPRFLPWLLMALGLYLLLTSHAYTLLSR